MEGELYEEMAIRLDIRGPNAPGGVRGLFHPHAPRSAQLTPAQLAALIPLDPTNLPFVGTYWFLVGPSPGCHCPPLPFPPERMPEAPIYALGDGQYLVDDTLVDYAALRQQVEMESALRSLEFRNGLRASPGGEGTFSPMGLTSVHRR